LLELFGFDQTVRAMIMKLIGHLDFPAILVAVVEDFDVVFFNIIVGSVFEP
jgi:hypothetical protein